MPDDPHVHRTIRTPNAVVTIKGTLTEVDRLYRAANSAFLACGYSIPTPGKSPWQGYEVPDEPNIDHLQRRLNEVERQLAESQDHEVMQTLRRQLSDTRLTLDTYKQAFIDLDANVQSALRALKDDTSLGKIIALQLLSEL